MRLQGPSLVIAASQLAPTRMRRRSLADGARLLTLASRCSASECPARAAAFSGRTGGLMPTPTPSAARPGASLLPALRRSGPATQPPRRGAAPCASLASTASRHATSSAPSPAAADAGPVQGQQPAGEAPRTATTDAAAAGEQQSLKQSPASRPVRGSRESDNLKSLLRLPCVGRRHADMLTEKGLVSAEKLREVFVSEHERQVESLSAYLRTQVGVRTKLHADSIAAAVSALSDEGAGPVTICVEGNISAGKSTFLRSVKGSADGGVDGALRALRVVPEPIDRWTSVPILRDMARGATGDRAELNILSEFYKDPKRWAYTFQNWVFFTRFMQERESANPLTSLPASLQTKAGRHGLTRRPAKAGAAPFPDYRLMERSVFSDRLVFVEALSDDRMLSDTELAIYKNWFEFMLEDKPQLVPDAFIYLRADPDTCHARMNKRGRGEESGVPLNYLEMLHEKHEGWFFPGGLNTNGNKVGVQDGTNFGVSTNDEIRRLLQSELAGEGSRRLTPELESSTLDAINSLMPNNIRDKVIFMRTHDKQLDPHAPLHERVIRRVPALILDCNGDTDVENDKDARNAYGAMVASFYQFVADLKKVVYPLVGPPGTLEAEPAFEGAHSPSARRMEAELHDAANARRKAEDRKISKSAVHVVLPTRSETAQFGAKMAAAAAR